ncbi:hypothetical protein A9R00_02685, partial [Oleispira antarctica]
MKPLYFKTLLLLSINSLFFSINSQAADSEYEQWLKQTQTEFQSYLDENDKAFIGFLNEKWESVNVEKPTVRDPEPKPLDMPIAEPIVITEPERIEQPIIVAPIVLEP